MVTTTTTITATASPASPAKDSTTPVPQGTNCNTEKVAAIAVGVVLGCALFALLALGMLFLHKNSELARVKGERNNLKEDLDRVTGELGGVTGERDRLKAELEEAKSIRGQRRDERRDERREALGLPS